MNQRNALSLPAWSFKSLRIRQIVLSFVLCLSSGQFVAADIYSLATDFSNLSNPNGVWSFTRGTTLLTHFAQPADGNALNPAAGNGFWGVGPSFNSDVPFMFQTTLVGSAVPPYTDEDFLLGDVFVHASNVGDEVFINWTAPNAGSLTYTGSVWYGHSFTNRSNDFLLQLNGGAPLNSGTVTVGQGRSNAVMFNSSGSINVNAGDVLSISLFRSSGQSFGALSGVDFVVDFTAVPEPGGLVPASAIGLFCLLRRNRRSVLKNSDESIGESLAS
ncbi:MAG TPA: hypothetical protein PKD64_08980 [Pirellulaceae bacterium]|nr:hypothetical protein [Pirellulaceae bacterium]HMO92320.1 hypothetical protein [Pirellulaceae bacterium]HMP69244.1 hypothetical protein [Pirellulaceae bacterium]